jgi:hypothetical protein
MTWDKSVGANPMGKSAASKDNFSVLYTECPRKNAGFTNFKYLVSSLPFANNFGQVQIFYGILCRFVTIRFL